MRSDHPHHPTEEHVPRFRHYDRDQECERELTSRRSAATAYGLTEARAGRREANSSPL
jgi:hypothetical protein